ncbi:pyruvate carboxylase [Alkalithermobacter thermoalcaliphilus JW-YL-7 = DSM 7308]|uniref:Pyruvate carboxylase n=1 Tax=Alkalithermobacter thermoalcaliphilus JW-YL-7 = DSM 7308 TaxID=1121328 RepID=A0A150FQT2_CLOPD|nr:pyruvate carboxylase [[Clostridium] paradoxum JW-YL-7 = DSM 7308]SHK75892.1 pyruvate carboxylase [[Clostridium] paradoxum JW-YL-7 = DSM 7308]
MIKNFKKVLVANRGEIAIRIFRACHELGIRTVGVYSKEDKYSLFRSKADESYLIGENKGPIEAYLSMEEIIDIAKRKNVDAIHPGYGFLSENHEFAKMCEENGITFIGPSYESMQKIGDKINSKKIAKQIKVPVIPGVDYPIEDISKAKQICSQIGYPVILKASNGGGGRGMRIIYKEEDLELEFDRALSEAEKAFGKAVIFIEKYLDNPKHIEVQILGDKYGNIVHLYERDCSVQRRHQKIIEYAPAFSVSQQIKNKIYEDALRLAKQSGYYNAGTVEFLVDRQGNYYFIEMNPRIQVEHTVTEMVTGIDIVQSQILIAQGYSLDSDKINIKSQEDIKVNGYSIQCRITTEDPKNNFMPDTGKINLYRTGSGFGIRLDGGNGFTGVHITPYYDSLLVKTISWDRSFDGAIRKSLRSISELRIRGVKTNVGFLINVLNHPVFKSGNFHTNFLDQTPELFDIKEGKDRATKILKFIGNITVNENKGEKIDFKPMKVNNVKIDTCIKGSKDILNELGTEKFIEYIKKENKLFITDTTMRDAHQSLLATRFRTIDLLKISTHVNNYMNDLFSIEMWGGATFDVCYRFLKESPWIRLRKLRERIPNILFQMLLRASNGVGYKNYPDNVIKEFIKQSAQEGIDIFRIFDSLNWIENMKVPIYEALNTGKIVEGTICYSGDILDKTRNKYTLNYYIKMAKELEKLGVHILAIKDMAGLLKPYAAYELVKALKQEISIPIHLHTHDTSGNGIASLLMASEAGVDIVDCAIESMSGLTSQPSLNSLVYALKNTPRDTKINLDNIKQINEYYKDLRQVYYKFESKLKTSYADIYKYEIPGGQYTNLKPQLEALGLSDKFEQVKEKYKEANEILGDIIKVTPSSKVVGDLAVFMVKNKLNKENIIEKGESLSFPDSVVDYFKGMIGQPEGGFPEKLQQIVLKKEKPINMRPGKLLKDVDFDQLKKEIDSQYKMSSNILNVLSYSLYNKVYKEYLEHLREYSDVSMLDSDVFFYGLRKGEECEVEIEDGKLLTIKLIEISDTKEDGYKTLTFEVNGMRREIEIKDKNFVSAQRNILKADFNNKNHVGASIPGKVIKILVKENKQVKENQPLIVIESMKIETTILSKANGIVDKIYVSEQELVSDKQLLITIK